MAATPIASTEPRASVDEDWEDFFKEIRDEVSKPPATVTTPSSLRVVVAPDPSVPANNKPGELSSSPSPSPSPSTPNENVDEPAHEDEWDSFIKQVSSDGGVPHTPTAIIATLQSPPFTPRSTSTPQTPRIVLTPAERSHLPKTVAAIDNIDSSGSRQECNQNEVEAPDPSPPITRRLPSTIATVLTTTAPPPLASPEPGDFDALLNMGEAQSVASSIQVSPSVSRQASLTRRVSLGRKGSFRKTNTPVPIIFTVGILGGGPEELEHITNVSATDDCNIGDLIQRIAKKHNVPETDFILRDVNTGTTPSPEVALTSVNSRAFTYVHRSVGDDLVTPMAGRTAKTYMRRVASQERLSAQSSSPNEPPPAATETLSREGTLSRFKRNLSLTVRIGSPFKGRGSASDKETPITSDDAATPVPRTPYDLLSPGTPSRPKSTLLSFPQTPVFEFSVTEPTQLPPSPPALSEIRSRSKSVKEISLPRTPHPDTMPKPARTPPPEKRKIASSALIKLRGGSDSTVVLTPIDVDTMLMASEAKVSPSDLNNFNADSNRRVAVVRTPFFGFSSIRSKAELVAGSWKGMISLNDVSKVSIVPDDIFHRRNCFFIMTPAKDTFFQAANPNERHEWIQTILKHKPDQRPSSEPASAKVGEYHIGATVGAGAYAEVHLGHHERTSERVAIKVIKNMPEDDQYTERLNREIALLRRLDHCHINKMFQAVTTQDVTYLVMEYIEGETLDDFVFGSKEGRLPEHVSRFLFRKILSAVEYCHDRCIVHRDLKMENVMVTKTGDVKLIDFGLGVSYEGPESLLGTFCGTLEYAAPEVLSKEKTYKGPPTDVWSLGVVLFLMISGTYPFLVEGLVPVVAAAHMRDKCDALSYPDIMSPGVISMIQRILIANPLQRATIKELLVHPWLTILAEIEDSLDPPELFFAA